MQMPVKYVSSVKTFTHRVVGVKFPNFPSLKCQMICCTEPSWKVEDGKYLGKGSHFSRLIAR